LNRSRTNWEFLRDLRAGANRHIADILRPMTVDFDRIWYGFAPAGRADFDRARQIYGEVKALAGQPGSATGNGLLASVGARMR
jgi:hypothetical protein